MAVSAGLKSEDLTCKVPENFVPEYLVSLEAKSESLSLVLSDFWEVTRLYMTEVCVLFLWSLEVKKPAWPALL